ncbi:MAG: hypothetical protein HWN69_02660 [Desulfobacterales bacterium]|nr:hypothetical protein [Desulfobacterales bacterium]
MTKYKKLVADDNPNILIVIASAFKEEVYQLTTASSGKATIEALTIGKKGGIVMASNFRISVHRNSDSLHLKLIGDFDGTSACELLNLLRENCNAAVRVFINTTSLKNIYPFGQDTFQNRLYLLKGLPIRLVFTGENAVKIAPEQNNFF